MTRRKLLDLRHQAIDRDPETHQQILENLAAEKPIVKDLVELGYDVESLPELPFQGKTWKSALPVLLRWLTKIENLDVKGAVVECLSVPWVSGSGTALLIGEFRKYASVPDSARPWKELSHQERKARASSLLAWTLGNALSIVDIRGFESEIIELCRNPAYGSARQMMVMELGRLRSAQAEDAALELLDDENVRAHAISALGKMKSHRALPSLEKLLADKTPLVRKNARKTIKEITQQAKFSR
jgi:hypothetical protein